MPRTHTDSNLENIDTATTNQLTAFLLLCILLLVVLNEISSHFPELGDFFKLSEEKNLPTLFSTIILFYSAWLLRDIASIQRSVKQSSLPWFGLAIIFLFLGLDESLRIHERTMPALREMFGYKNRNYPYLYFAWIIPYGLGVLLLGMLYHRFVINLPQRTRFLIIISAIVYVTGALVIEVWQSGDRVLYGNKYGHNSLLYSHFSKAGETLEMVGILLFIHALRNYRTTIKLGAVVRGTTQGKAP